MARFDVYKYSKNGPLVLDVQADLLASLKTRVVVPLLPYAEAKAEAVPRLKPVVTVKGKKHVLMVTDIGAVEVAKLGVAVDNIEAQRQEVTATLDFLMQGF